jgi:uncharacterized protein (DUF1330 family)
MGKAMNAPTSQRFFLVVKAFCQHLRFARFVPMANAIAMARGGVVIVARPVHQVTAIEPGSVPAHLWIAHFSDRAAADAAWADLKGPGHIAAITQDVEPIVLAMDGVPLSGLPDFIPTPGNVTPPESLMQPAYFLVEGSANDQDRMDKYRDILLPMMKERHAYYIAFELGGNVRVLSGRWSEAIFAISRWPSIAFAQDAWMAARYQVDAIPLRLGVGKFSVLVADGP